MSKEEAGPSSDSGKVLSPAQRAAQLTWQLKGDLKNLQIARLRVAAMLARFRDERLYADLGCEDMEHYAKDRLKLSRESLYKYLRVYDWVKAHQPAWLEQHPKGFIPELSDIVDLAWIEKELADKNITEDRKDELLMLRSKAAKGELVQKDLGALRRRASKPAKSLRAFLSALRALVRRAAKLVRMPPEVIEHLEAAVSILENRDAIDVAGLEIIENWPIRDNQTDFA
jgi:hypothetical protein